MVNHPNKGVKGLAKWMIWSIRYQNYLITRIHLYIWTAVSIPLFMVFTGVMSLEAAILSIFIGGFAILFLLWLFIEFRRIWLLRVRDPEIRAAAHETMIVYIYANHRIQKSLCKQGQGYWCRQKSRTGNPHRS